MSLSCFRTFVIIVYAHGPRYSYCFDMEVQPLVTHNAAWPLYVSAILHRCREQSFAIPACAISAVGIDIVSVHKLFEYRVVSAVCTDIVSSHTKYCRIAYGIKK